MGRPAREGPQGDPGGPPHEGARPAHQPLWPAPLLLHQLRGLPPLHRAAAPRGESPPAASASRASCARSRAPPAWAAGSSRCRWRSRSVTGRRAARTSPRCAPCRSTRLPTTSTLKLSHRERQIAEPISRRSRRGWASCSTSASATSRSTARPARSPAARPSASAWRRRSAPASSASATCSTSRRIGLHQRDNTRLIRTLQRLQDIGNTVIMVEHDEDCIRAADYLIDIGPGRRRARRQRRRTPARSEQLLKHRDAEHTIKYLTGEFAIPVPAVRRPPTPGSELPRAQGLPREQPQERRRPHPARRLRLRHRRQRLGQVHADQPDASSRAEPSSLRLEGQGRRPQASTASSKIDKVIEIDQSPIGRTPRSNPATYTGVFDEIRKVFAKTREAKIRGYEAGPLQLQRQGRPLRGVPGPGHQVHRDALPPRRLRQLRGLPRQRATTPRRSRSTTAARPSPTCWT